MCFPTAGSRCGRAVAGGSRERHRQRMSARPTSARPLVRSSRRSLKAAWTDFDDALARANTLPFDGELPRDRRRKNLRVARECVLLARLADSVELRDEPIQLLRMVESSSEPRSRRNFRRLLSCFPVAIGPLRFSRRIPPIKHIRRGVASRVALILGVHGTFAAGFQRLGQKDGLV